MAIELTKVNNFQPVPSILEYFPLACPRPKQIKALQFVERAYNEGYRDIVIEAPTGAGKSALSVAICRWAEATMPHETVVAGGYVLVMQKVLQDQMANDIGKFSSSTQTAKIIKSAVEYDCPNFKKCSVGMARKCDCLRSGACTYRRAKGEFLRSTVAITNYAYFIAERQFAGELLTRYALCLDESANLARFVTSHVGLTVNKESLKDYAPTIDPEELHVIGDIHEYAHWVKNTYVEAAKARAAVLMALADQDEKAIQRAFEIEQHALKALSFSERILNGDTQDWVFWKEDGKKPNDLNLSAKPLVAYPYFEELFGGFPLRVYLSAYPGAKGTFCRELGLEPSGVAWIRLNSTFPVENRPVHLIPVGSMGMKSQDQTLPSVLRMIGKILDKHPERGLIHTHSYKLADAIVNFLQGTAHASRLIYPKNAEERDSAMAQHAQQEGAVLVSPSIFEGFDFKDDLARWSIMAKCPWPSLGDKQVEAKSQRDPAWYAFEALKAVVQTCGRTVRSETDHAVTYILDADVKRLLDEHRNSVPTWFSEAVICH